MEISDPTLAYLLIILGLTGIGIEAITPGGFVPAILGIIALMVIGLADIGPTGIGLGLLLLAIALFISAVAFRLYRPLSIAGSHFAGRVGYLDVRPRHRPDLDRRGDDRIGCARTVHALRNRAGQ